MSFLAPLFLIGAAAIGLPVVFHLIRRTTRERTLFSSLMFLLPTPPRLTRRSRLENILLLLLRCLVLCLLAFAFARPFFARPVAPGNISGAARKRIILLDASASMRRANLWSDARAKAESVLREAGPADEVALFTFDRQLAPVLTFEQWQSTPISERAALAAGRLKSISPGWAGTHLGNALIGAAEMFSDTTGKAAANGPKQIVLISDLQEGCHLDQLQGYEWPKGIELLVERLPIKRSSNAGLQLVADPEDSDPQKSSGVRVRVANAADSQREQFKIGWASANAQAFADKPVEVYVPPGQSRIVSLPLPENHAGLDRITLQGDDEDYDNTVFVLPPEASRTTVLYLGNETERDAHQPLYFLKRAFQETRRELVQVIGRTPKDAVTSSEIQNAALIIVTDPIPEQLADLLHQQAVLGKTVLIAPKSEALALTLARLLGVERVLITESRPAGYAMLAQIDFRHPLFAPFVDPRFSDFTKIHFWQYRRIDPASIAGARVLAGFDHGDPALLELPMGKGRAMVLTSGWHPADSQLALSTKFVPLLYSMLEEGGALNSAPAQYEVGDTVPISTTPEASPASLSVQPPVGPLLKLSTGETNFSQTIMPGIYSVVPTQPARRFAVNLDAAESRTAPLPADELERLGAPISLPVHSAAREAEKRVRLQNTELENRQKLWRWFLVATLAALLMETWLSGRTTRRQSILAPSST